MGWLKPKPVVREVLQELSKASNEAATVPSFAQPKAYQYDPEDVNARRLREADAGKYAAHPGVPWMTYRLCSDISRTSLVSTAISLRANQAIDCFKPQKNQFSLGYIIKKKGYDHQTLKSSDKRRIQEIQTVLDRGGSVWYKGGLSTLIENMVWQTYPYDQITFERIFDRSGKLWASIPVDAATIRRAIPNDRGGNGVVDPRDVRYVQMMNRRVVREFTDRKLAFCVRRQFANVDSYGYGWPETERVMTAVANLLNAQTRNASKFVNGVSPRMLIGVRAKMGADVWKDFEQQIAATLSGVAARGRVPMLQLNPDTKEDITAIQLNPDGDMEHQQWMNWCVKDVCAAMDTDPAEVGWVFGNEGQSSGLQNSSAADRVLMGKKKGLHPLIVKLSQMITDEIIAYIYDDYEIVVLGLDDNDEDTQNKIDISAVTNFATVNEIRAKRKLPKLPSEQGDIILNSTWYQHFTAIQADKKEKEQAKSDMDDIEQLLLHSQVAQNNATMADGGNPTPIDTIGIGSGGGAAPVEGTTTDDVSMEMVKSAAAVPGEVRALDNVAAVTGGLYMELLCKALTTLANK